MRVLISGQAGVAVSIDAPRYLYALDQQPVAAPATGNAWRLFDGCADVEEHELPHDDIGAALERAWAIDRCLRVFLFLIDPHELESDLTEYAHCVEQLLTQFDLETELLLRLSSSPFPIIIETKRVREAVTGCPSALALFSRVLDLQGHIIKVHEAFENISDSFFDTDLERQHLHDSLNSEGAFSELALALEQGTDISFLKLKITNRHLSDREVVAQWTAALQGSEKRRSGRVFADEDVDADDDWEFETDAERRSSHEVYQWIRNEQAEIVNLLRLRELDQARTRTSELIRRQRANSNSEQIAKSLCFMAQAAKLQEVPELQLEWADQATLENSADPRTFGQLADALITMGSYGDAEMALDKMEAVGGRQYAETARARILRTLGFFAEARERYLAVAQEFNDAPEIEHAWMGAADTLKDMGRLDESIAEYRELTQRWPFSTYLWSGYAFALLEAGRIDDAIITFGKSSAQRPNKNASNGRAFALRQSGRLNEAMAIYDQVIENYPNDHVALCGRAEIFRFRGQHQLALAAFDLASARSPYIPAPLLGRAATLSDIGALDDAQRLWEDIDARFPNEPAAAIGIVRILRRKGRLNDALQRVDRLIAGMPYLVSAKILRAQILQSQGLFDSALTSLDVVTSNHPFSVGAVSAKANLLISMGRIDDAERILPRGRPKTQIEWSRFLLRSIIVESSMGAGSAASQLEWALSKCPFFLQRRNLRNALTSLELRRRRWREARRTVESAPTEVSDVIALHAFAASHRYGHARRLLGKIQSTESSPEIISLADEIARRTKLVDEPTTRSVEWIGNAERALILMDAA